MITIFINLCFLHMSRDTLYLNLINVVNWWAIYRLTASTETVTILYERDNHYVGLDTFIRQRHN